MAAPTCVGAYDVVAACMSCQREDTCPSCDACQSGNAASCSIHNSCERCTECNTLCDTCQALCEKGAQTFAGACGNAFPSDRWTNVQKDDSIAGVFPQGKFYWAWSWLTAAINYGSRTHSPGSATLPSIKDWMMADHWNQLNTAMQSLKTNATQLPVAVAGDTKITAELIKNAGNALKDIKINKIACHFQNTKWDSCGPTSSECLQTCGGCMNCTSDSPVTCTSQGDCSEFCCTRCNSGCQSCVNCQGCNECQSCVNCMTACDTCNACNTEQTG